MKSTLIILSIILCGILSFSCKTKKVIELDWSKEGAYLIAKKPQIKESSIKVQLVSLYVDNDTTSIPITDNPPFSGEFMPPRYKGGWKELTNYLEKEINYFPSVQEKGIQGKIRMRFHIDKHGNITNIQPLRGQDIEIDKEVIRAIKSIPNAWLPAICNNEYINFQITIDVFLKLEFLEETERNLN